MGNTGLRIGILETGRPPVELISRYGDYPSMIRTWLGKLDAVFSSYAVLDEDFPNHPGDADLWVITGSKFSVLDDLVWIPPLMEFIRTARETDTLMLGICFGHQIIARALGGVVRKSAKGWGLGIHEYPATGAWPPALGKPPEPIAIQAFHQDQVEEKPAAAVTIASTDFCPHAALWYPDFALTVQGHPEFDRDYVGALLENRRGDTLSNEDVSKGLLTMTRADNRTIVAKLVETLLLKQDS